jgi:FtsP/CotA-like multicopper oxidase with cupredoxin domain
MPIRAVLDGKLFVDPLSPDDRIANGTTVEWDIVNLTADTHPIHLHLVHFSVISRRRFDTRGYQAALDAQRRVGQPDGWDPVDRTGYRGWMSQPVSPVAPFLGKSVAVAANERGYKDTVRANPGEVTRIRARFQVPGAAPGAPARYVWHCHILEHEDNDMMRPYEVT